MRGGRLTEMGRKDPPPPTQQHLIGAGLIRPQSPRVGNESKFRGGAFELQRAAMGVYPCPSPCCPRTVINTALTRLCLVGAPSCIRQKLEWMSVVFAEESHGRWRKAQGESHTPYRDRVCVATVKGRNGGL